MLLKVKELKCGASSKRQFSKIDSEVIEDFVQGKSYAFQIIYSRFKKPVLKMVLHRIRNADVAEELVQETFIKVFRYRRRYNPQYEFSTWIWTIAKNLTIDYLAKSYSDPLGVRPTQDLGYELTEIACDRGCAETVLLKKSERKYLFKLLKKLPRLQRKAIILRVIKGCSYNEIAKSLELSLSAVKSLIHRGKSSLQNSIIPV